MWYELIFSISLHFISFPLHATVKPPRYAFCHCQSTLSTVSSKIIGQMRIYIIYMYIYNICDNICDQVLQGKKFPEFL